MKSLGAVLVKVMNNYKQYDMIDEAVDRVAMNEDIWDVIRWLLRVLGITSKRRMKPFATIDAAKIRGGTVGGIADMALRRSLLHNQRKFVEVIPLIRHKKIVVRRDASASGSKRLASRVVQFLVARGGTVLT